MTRDEWVTAYMTAHQVTGGEAYAAYVENPTGDPRIYNPKGLDITKAGTGVISSIERAAAAAAASAQSMTDKNKGIPTWAWLGLAGVAAWLVWRS